MGSSLTSYNIAVSGLNTAQYGLATTGHNISNADTQGYTRQQVIQKDSKYHDVLTSSSEYKKSQLGLGTNVSIIRQIRNKFFDADYRNQESKESFYSVKYTTGLEVENIIGELESDYKMQDVLEDVWNSLNELTIHPEGIETRGIFIGNCVKFLDKVEAVSNELYTYQINLNDQVINTVNEVNSILEQVANVTQDIYKAEVNGDRANDYRDTRNNLLDQLSSLIDVNIKEKENGDLSIFADGKEIYTAGIYSKIGLRYTSGEYPFVEPIIGSPTEEILPYGTEAIPLYNIERDISANDPGATKGALRGLLISRGNTVANYTSDESDTENYLIPKVQKKIDTLVHSVVTMINDAVNPIDKKNAPYDLEGNKGGIEVFVRKTGYDRYKQLEDANDYASLYTMGNIEVNPELRTSDGYNKLAFSATGDVGDVSIINGLMSQWKDNIEELNNMSVDNYYRSVISDISVEVEEAGTYYDEQNSLLDTITNKRSALSGVSIDEELTNMIKYQHAYNAASRLINVVDSMIDKVINGTGRVGL